MKAICISLVAYVLGLAIVPCSEAIEGCLLGHSDDIEVISSHDLPDQDSDHDHCTPFCVCDCCGISIWTLDADSAFEATLIVPSTTPSFVSSLVEDPSPQGVWRPPSLG